MSFLDEDDVIFVGTEHYAGPRGRISIVDLCSPDKDPSSSVLSQSNGRRNNEYSTAPHSDKNSDPNENQNILKCSICLDSSVGNNPHSTTCGHIFCGDCIKSAIKIHKKCPMCNNPLNIKSIHQVYL